MSDLDKEAVLDEFAAAYKKAHGKKPKVEDSNGWYSVDGGKNMRLAQLDEWTQELKSGKKAAANNNKESDKKDSDKKDSKKKESAKSSKSSTAKKSATSKAGSKKADEKSSEKGTKKTAKKTAKKTTKKSASKSTAGTGAKSKAKKSPAKKSATKKSKSKQDAGFTPAQAWQAHLEQQDGQSRLPRGFKAD